jgi:transcriptional regulator with XRE-family HTH domain
MTGKKLKQWRSLRGWTQTELAAALALPNPSTSGKTTVSRWENGARPIPTLLPAALKGLEKK